MFSQYWSLMAWKTKQAPYWQPIQYLGWQLKFIFSCIGDSLVAILDFDIESFHFSLPDPWAHPNGFYIIYCEDCLVKAENYFMQKLLGLLFSVTIVWMKNRSPSTCTVHKLLYFWQFVTHSLQMFLERFVSGTQPRKNTSWSMNTNRCQVLLRT